jgi:hypothetical protein
MELVRRIRVQGFRSIGDQTLEGFGGVTTLVGKNSSGKSNVLRALNLFFNDEVDPDEALDFGRDSQFDPGPKSKKKKRIVISASFRLPSNFHFPKSISAAETRLGSEFTISRTWERDRQKRIVSTLDVVTGSPGSDDMVESARQFLNLLTYRYIPNRTVPALVLRDESKALAKAIQIRLKGNTVGDLLSALQGAAGRLLKPIGRSFRATGAPLADPQVSAPGDLGELLTVTGFQATGLTGATVRDQEWGAGHQAFFLYELLCALDTHYSKFFGWKQAAIWGVEEPESGLHNDLETSLAQEFRRWVADPRCKLQVIETTHSPVFTMAADIGYWCAIDSGTSGFNQIPIPALVREAELRGVSGWTQPVLAFPTSSRRGRPGCRRPLSCRRSGGRSERALRRAAAPRSGREGRRKGRHHHLSQAPRGTSSQSAAWSTTGSSSGLGSEQPRTEQGTGRLRNGRQEASYADEAVPL